MEPTIKEYLTIIGIIILILIAWLLLISITYLLFKPIIKNKSQNENQKQQLITKSQKGILEMTKLEKKLKAEITKLQKDCLNNWLIPESQQAKINRELEQLKNQINSIISIEITEIENLINK